MRRQRIKSIYPIVILISLFCCELLWWVITCSAAVQTSNQAGNVTYYYTTKEMVSDRKTGITVLKGEAKFRTSDNNYMNADQVTIYQKVENGKVTDLIKIEAAGNVDMKEGDLKATCAHSIIYQLEDRIELEGSPAIVDAGKSKIEAPAITYFRKDDRLEARGNVSGNITIEEKKNEK